MFVEIQNGSYYCEQADIDIFSAPVVGVSDDANKHPLEDATYICTDSGAVYKTGFDTTTKLDGTQITRRVYVLDDIIRKNDVEKRPAIVCFDDNTRGAAGYQLLKGRNFRIKEVNQNLLYALTQYSASDNQGMYRNGATLDTRTAEDNPENWQEELGITTFACESFDIAIKCASGTSLSAGDIKIGYKVWNQTTSNWDFVTLFENEAVDTSGSAFIEDVKFSSEILENLPYARLALDVKPGVAVDLGIFDHKWNIANASRNTTNKLNWGFDFLCLVDKTPNASMTKALSRKMLYDLSGYKGSQVPMLGNLDDTKYAFDGKPIEKLTMNGLLLTTTYASSGWWGMKSAIIEIL